MDEFQDLLDLSKNLGYKINIRKAFGTSLIIHAISENESSIYGNFKGESEAKIAIAEHFIRHSDIRTKDSLVALGTYLSRSQQITVSKSLGILSLEFLSTLEQVMRDKYLKDSISAFNPASKDENDLKYVKHILELSKSYFESTGENFKKHEVDRIILGDLEFQNASLRTLNVYSIFSNIIKNDLINKGKSPLERKKPTLTIVE